MKLRRKWKCKCGKIIKLKASVPIQELTSEIIEHMEQCDYWKEKEYGY